MPKLKTHRGAAKRFKSTASGKFKRSKAYMSHILTKKTRKRKRKLDTPTLVSSADMSRVKAMLPYFTEQYGNAASTTHPFGWQAKESVDAARATIATATSGGRETVPTSHPSRALVSLSSMSRCRAPQR